MMPGKRTSILYLGISRSCSRATLPQKLSPSDRYARVSFHKFKLIAMDTRRLTAKTLGCRLQESAVIHRSLQLFAMNGDCPTLLYNRAISTLRLTMSARRLQASLMREACESLRAKPPVSRDSFMIHTIVLDVRFLTNWVAH
jgi:hypothetical protein